MEPSGSSKILAPRPTIVGLLCAAGWVGGVSTLLGFAGRFWWVLDLFSHFRVQYFVGLAITGVILALMRRSRSAVVFALFAAVNLVLILPFYLPVRGGTREQPARLRAMLVNLNILNTEKSLALRVIAEQEPDVIVLEEVNSAWHDALGELREAYPFNVAQPREDYYGIALFSRLPLAEAGMPRIGPVQVPSVVGRVRVDGRSVYVVGTHPPPPLWRRSSLARNAQLEDLADFITGLDGPVLLLGDLNSTQWSPHFRSFLKRSGLKDSSRGRGWQPTWPALPRLLRIPVDHCLHSPEIVVVSRRVGPYTGSDHYPLIVDFTFCDPAP